MANTTNTETTDAANPITTDAAPKTPTAPVHAKPPTRLLMSEHMTMSWDHYAEAGETFDLCKHPDTWKNVLLNLRQGHKICVHSAEGLWYGELYVRAVSRVEIVLGVIVDIKFGASAEVADDVPYTTKWRGPTAQWSVVLKKNNDVVKEHFQTKEAASAWIVSHMRAMAA